MNTTQIAQCQAMHCMCAIIASSGKSICSNALHVRNLKLRHIIILCSVLHMHTFLLGSKIGFGRVLDSLYGAI